MLQLVVGDAFMHCQVCCLNSEHYVLQYVTGDGFLHFRVMLLSTQKHGRTGIPQRKKLLKGHMGREASIVTKGSKNLTRKHIVQTNKIHCTVFTFVKYLGLLLTELPRLFHIVSAHICRTMNQMCMPWWC